MNLIGVENISRRRMIKKSAVILIVNLSFYVVCGMDDIDFLGEGLVET
jgi:hypothetical protein